MALRCRMLMLSAWLGGLLLAAGPAEAWNDETHVAIARAAGYGKWYNAAGADIAKEKADQVEKQNHYCNNSRGKEVTVRQVLEQAERYNRKDDPEGHLYGAIVAALRSYAGSRRDNKYGQYHVAYAVHYLGDLSQPLHSTPFDDYNRDRHAYSDAMVDKQILDNLERINKHIYPVTLRSERFEADLAAEIARIANLSRQLGLRLRAEQRDMTAEEAYRQLGESASLLRAVLQHFRL